MQRNPRRCLTPVRRTKARDLSIPSLGFQPRQPPVSPLEMATGPVASSKPVDESLWWDSFVLLFEELDAASLSAGLPEILVKKIKNNHAWFLDSVTQFKPPNKESRLALDSPEISVGSHRLVIKPELKDVALRASSCLYLDEVQSYILVKRTFELNKSAVVAEGQEVLQLILLQYYLERQCLLKCVRCIFVHTLYVSSGSSKDAIRMEALQLVDDGLEGKLLAILQDLFSSAPAERTEVDFMVLWVEESLIENNLTLDILFLCYYDNFCNCNVEQWKTLCLLFKGTLSGSSNIGNLAASVEASNSFVHSKAQLLLILIETLDLENLLHTVHDEVPLRLGCSKFSLSDVQEIDALVSGFSDLGAVEAEPLILAWAIFICLLSSLPDGRQNSILMEIDHVGYVRQAFETASLNYLLEILRSDTFRDSYDLVSGFLCIMRTFMSAFIAAYDLTHQGDDHILNVILDIIYEIYHGEESLSLQFWDRDSFVDGPIRSLLYVLEREYPFHTVKLVRLLSALVEGEWSAECVYNFLDNMRGLTLPFEISGGSCVDIEARYPLNIPGVEGFVILGGTRGHCLKMMDENVLLVRWECPHSGIFLLLLQLAQEPHPDSYDKIVLTLQLLNQMVSFNVALCFSLLNIDKSLSIEAARKGGQIEKNVRIDVVKIVCSLICFFVQDASNSGVISICFNVLAQMIKCAPSHVIDVVLRSNIFRLDIDSSSSGNWLFSGGLARMLLADFRENAECFELIISVLDFTVCLLEMGAENDLVSALVGFSLQYVLVNHLNWICKLKQGRWKLTLKVLEVMKTCVKEFSSSHRHGVMFRDILVNDSSIHNVLCRIIYMPIPGLEGSFVTSYSGTKEGEDMFLTVRFALDIVYSMLATLSEGITSNTPALVQTMLSSTKRIPVVSAVISLIHLFHNPALQVSAVRLLSMLCYMASRVQPYSVENAGLLVDAIQVRNLNNVIYTILEEEQTKNEDLVAAIFDLLISAGRYQPSLLVCLLLAEEEMQASSDSPSSNNILPAVAHVICPLKHDKSSSLNSILKYLRKSEVLMKSSPRVVLSIFILLKTLWEGGIQYIHILEKIRMSDMFWKNLSSVLDTNAEVTVPAEDLERDQFDCQGYRFQCQGTVLQIMAHELFLQEKLLQDDRTSNTHHLKVILSSWCESSSLDYLIISYSSGRYDNLAVLNAKLSVCLCVVHLVSKLSAGDGGCLSISLVEKIGIISNKLSYHPAFSALLAQYASHRYREEKELKSLILNDLYYQLQGQLEGREIAPGHFQELSHFLLELGIFQCDECNYERNIWPSEKDIHMFHIPRLSAEFQLDHWNYSDLKASREVVERMFVHMHHANSVMLLAYSQLFALKSLTAIIYLCEGNIPKTKSLIGSEISDPLIESSIKYLCKQLQTMEDSIAPTLNPSVELLEHVLSQVELLLVLSRILFGRYSHGTNARQFLPLSVLLIKTSGSGIRFLVDIRPSTVVLNSAMKLLLLLLLTTYNFVYPFVSASDKSDLEGTQFAEVSLISMRLVPILCKFVENTELSDLSVASLDLMLKGFLDPNAWLNIMRKHLQLRLIIKSIQLKDSPVSVSGILNFLLALANVKGGAEMLHSAGIFSCLKVLFTQLVNDYPFSGELDELIFPPALSKDENHSYQWDLGLAIITSMVNALADDFTCTDIVDGAISYFFSEKAYIIVSSLSAPVFPADDQSKKRARSPKAHTTLAALRVTEQTIVFMCVLARHQASWSKGTKEMGGKIRETAIHLLAFISRGVQRLGESPNKSASVVCPPSLKVDVELNGKPSCINSNHGWFALSSGNASNTTTTNGLSLVTRPNENGYRAQPTLFSDTVAIQLYRIAFFVLEFLCMHAKAAARRAEEVEYIDLTHFPELPMPEILHGLQDQVIGIVTEVCEANRSKPLEAESEGVCLLLLQILEKALYLELCVSQCFGMRPVFGRIEDFSKEFKLLVEAVEHRSKLKASLRSVLQVIPILYPGPLQSNGLC